MSQGPIVRLGVEVYFHHLAPTSRPGYSEYVGDILPPSVGVNPASHHLAVDEVEMVGGKGEPEE